MSSNRYDLSIKKRLQTKNSARLLYITSAAYGGDWSSTPHTHYCSELFYVTSGVGQFQIEDEIYSVSANDLIIVNPNILHTELSYNTSPLKYIVLGIEGLELSVENQDSNFCIINLSSIRETILFYLKTMLHEIEQQHPGYEIICQNLMDILIVLLSRQTNFSTTFAPIQQKDSHFCTLIRNYIDVHYGENITLETLSELSHVNKYYLAHTFTETFGISPINYLINTRIKKAEKLLETSDYSLAFISRACGFSSSSYFAQTFKKINGVSPSIYRKQIREKTDTEQAEV